MRGGIARGWIPKDLSPKSTLAGYFSRWRQNGQFDRVKHQLFMAERERVGRDTCTTASVLDSESIKTLEYALDTSSEPLESFVGF